MNPGFAHPCSASVQPGFAFCPHCGTKVEAECRRCKKPVSRNWKLCPSAAKDCRTRHRMRKNDLIIF
ncbi:MAG: zinc ribbon domain-containing protein [Acidobacteria bacterium]|nr:zinc ribbon domain-containing protein [Acidobacteriota bacterium]